LAAEHSLRIDLADLDLKSAADARLALGRVTQAAVKLCGDPKVSGQDVGRAGGQRKCVTEAVERVLARFNSPTLIRAYDIERRAESGAPESTVAAVD